MNARSLRIASLALALAIGAAVTVSWTRGEPPAVTRSHAAFAAQLERVRTLPAGSAELPAMQAELDRLAGQRDAHLSGLYWHESLDDAKALAQASGKPILSLRLLGRLDEEYSCANSRFFRAILYPDPAIAALLRDRFILHWESVRPVPVITIDFGDGRTLKRTITGNSIHYVLSPDGRVVDALPGLIAPRLFERALQNVIEDLQSTRTLPFDSGSVDRHLALALAQPRAFDAGDFDLPAETSARLLASMSDANAVRPDRNAVRAGGFAISKFGIERPLLAVIRNPMPALTADTTLNLLELRPQILTWLRQDPSMPVAILNERVYRELFLTPLDDPMMGLETPDLYTGLSSAAGSSRR